MTVDENPSWLAVKPLHGTKLHLSSPPLLSKGSPFSATSSNGNGDSETAGRVAKIQTLQVPVHYGSVLDLVPRIHGSKPSSPEAKFWCDSRLDKEFGGKEGKLYPEAYPIEHPQSEENAGWDVVIHVGVGRGGSLRCETQAHKTGYGKPDANGSFAPILPTSDGIDPKHLDKEGRPRGFGVGYEQFSDTVETQIDVPTLVKWLKERGMGEEEVAQSLDPGRYLCDFIFYCSRVEAQRAGKGTSVIFVHVPPAGTICRWKEIGRRFGQLLGIWLGRRLTLRRRRRDELLKIFANPYPDP